MVVQVVLEGHMSCWIRFIQAKFKLSDRSGNFVGFDGFDLWGLKHKYILFLAVKLTSRQL